MLKVTGSSQQLRTEVNNLYPSQTSQTVREHMYIKEGRLCSTATTMVLLIVSLYHKLS